METNSFSIFIAIDQEVCFVQKGSLNPIYQSKS